MNHLKKLPNNSFEIFNFNEEGLVEELIKDLFDLGIIKERDVIVESHSRSSTNLTAVLGDFWYHTDGVFLKTTPHWIVIQLLEFEKGGELELLEFSHISENFYNDLYFFGKDNEGVKSKLYDNNVFRYRKDYMRPISDKNKFRALNKQIEQIHILRKINLPILSKFNCLLIDNWNLMHRRKDFEGVRIIRRIWLS